MVEVARDRLRDAATPAMRDISKESQQSRRPPAAATLWRQAFAAARFVVRRRRCPASHSSSRLACGRNCLSRDPRHFHHGLLDGVLAWTKLRLSNGALEGMNNKIKLVSHRAFGFRSVEYYVAAIYHCCAQLPLPQRS